MNHFLGVCKTRSTGHRVERWNVVAVDLKTATGRGDFAVACRLGWGAKQCYDNGAGGQGSNSSAACTSKTPQEPGRQHFNTKPPKLAGLCLCRHHLPVCNIQGTSSVAENWRRINIHKTLKSGAGRGSKSKRPCRPITWEATIVGWTQSMAPSLSLWLFGGGFWTANVMEEDDSEAPTVDSQLAKRRKTNPAYSYS